MIFNIVVLLRFVGLSVVRFVVSLSYSGESRGVEVEKTVDRVQPEPPTVIVVLGKYQFRNLPLHYDIMEVNTHLVVSADKPGVFVDEV